MPSQLLPTAVCALCLVIGAGADAAGARLHFAPNDNFAANGAYLPGQTGFNLADVANPQQLTSLPDGVKGLAWVGRCDGVSAQFVKIVRGYIDRPRLFGFYLMDDPEPRPERLSFCPPERLREEADWIHQNISGAKTFVALMNMGSSEQPSFPRSYNPAATHIDLFSIAPYPCRSELQACDLAMIDRYVAAAEAAGIPRDHLVPTYQAFGGGQWTDDRGGKYLLPTPRDEEQILARWAALVPTAAFDFAYSWGRQRGHQALEQAPDLQRVFARHNRLN